jgi:hypothetical protein
MFRTANRKNISEQWKIRGNSILADTLGFLDSLCEGESRRFGERLASRPPQRLGHGVKI